MALLEATVKQQLQITDTGVKNYMTVDAPDAGLVKILVTPGYNGVITQAKTDIGSTVQVQEVGNKWGVLLDAEGKQMGRPMNYDKLDTEPQIFYVGNDEDFKRGNHNITKKPNTRSIDIKIFGTEIPVRYATALGKDATVEALKNFQGFVIASKQSNRMHYRVWFELTTGNLEQACNNPAYNNIRGIPGFKDYSIIGIDEQFDLGAIGKKLEKAKYATLNLKAGGKETSIQFKPGKYTVQQVIDAIGRIKTPKPATAAVYELMISHLLQNHPLLLGKLEVHKNTGVVFSPGSLYTLTTEREVKPTYEGQSVETLAAPTAARRRQQQPTRVERVRGRKKTKPAARAATSEKRKKHVAAVRKASGGG